MDHNKLLLLDLHSDSGQMVWYSHLLKNFPQFVVNHTVKGFSVVNKPEENGRAKGTGDAFIAQRLGSSTAILVAKRVGRMSSQNAYVETHSPV